MSVTGRRYIPSMSNSEILHMSNMKFEDKNLGKLFHLKLLIKVKKIF